MKTKHTPGPWQFNPARIGQQYRIQDNKGSFLLEGVNIYDARLIAAAPDLLESLEVLAEYLNGRDLPNSILIHLHEAYDTIRKAKGGAK